jgi:hypothetical protein
VILSTFQFCNGKQEHGNWGLLPHGPMQHEGDAWPRPRSRSSRTLVRREAAHTRLALYLWAQALQLWRPSSMRFGLSRLETQQFVSSS